MPTYLTTIKSGEHAGRSFIVENVFNEAAAINETFKRAKLNKDETCKEYPSCDCCFVQIETLKVPINENEKVVTNSPVCRDSTVSEDSQLPLAKAGGDDPSPEIPD